MGVGPEFRTFVEDQLGPFGPVRVRAMFGGGGVFRDGVMFALIADDTLYFKVDDRNRPDYEAEGLEPFSYTARGKTAVMSYRRAPERLYDDAEEMAAWAGKAFDAAVAGAGAKKGRGG